MFVMINLEVDEVACQELDEDAEKQLNLDLKPISIPNSDNNKCDDGKAKIMQSRLIPNTISTFDSLGNDANDDDPSEKIFTFELS